MKPIAFATAAALIATTAVADASTRCASTDRGSDHLSSNKVSCAPAAANAPARPVHLSSASYGAFDTAFLPASRRPAAFEETGSLALFDPRLRHQLGLTSMQVPITDFDAIDDGGRGPEPRFDASEADASAAPADPSRGTIAATTVMLVGLVLSRRRKSSLSLRVSPSRT